MALLPYFFRAAVENLRRGGQRVMVALLCIAFGVMSVVSMTLLSEAIQRMIVITPPELIGGDISMDRIVEDSILPDHIAGLQAMRQAGKINGITLIAYTSSLAYRFPSSGEMHFPTAGMGVDPATYPLKGAFRVTKDMQGKDGSPFTATDMFTQPGDVLVTKDLMDEQHLKLGDTVLLSDLAYGKVVEGHIRGIVTDTPNHQGGKMYYALETARLLTSGAPAENTALVTTGNPQAVMADLKAQGWRAFSAVEMAESQREVEQMIEMSLKGAGILGMLVGGIGIANTMQVLLRRRRHDVAVFKTLGYRQGQLQLMFTIEAALLGTLGSLLGAALGVGISYILVGMFSGITDLLIHWVFSPLPVFNGILIGIVTTIVFAMAAIVVTSRVRPLAVLRSEALDTASVPWLQSLGLALLCVLPFITVTAVVMGSLVKGIGVLMVALVGLASMGGLLGGIVWVLTRVLPLRAWPLVHMARNNLRRRGFSLVFAMIALFVGVVSLSMGVIVTNGAYRAYDARLIKYDGDNLTIIAPATQELAIQRAAAALSAIKHVAPSYQAPVRSIQLAGNHKTTVQPLLIGFDELVDFQVQGTPWGSAPDGVYVARGYGIQPGSQVEIRYFDGTTRTLTVVGTYAVTLQGASPQPELGLLMSSALSRSLAKPETVQYYLRAPVGELNAVSAALGSALPNATVINLPAYTARYTQSFANLFVFATTMAGLALLAGALLIANSVSLAMLDRRYEIGVLKAIGYARRQVLFTLVVEYILVALIASGTGLLMVQVLLWLLRITNHLAGSLFVMSPQSTLLIALLSVGLTLFTVLGVTWRPVQVSPVVILNDRE